MPGKALEYPNSCARLRRLEEYLPLFIIATIMRSCNISNGNKARGGARFIKAECGSGARLIID